MKRSILRLINWITTSVLHASCRGEEKEEREGEREKERKTRYIASQNQDRLLEILELCTLKCKSKIVV